MKLMKNILTNLIFKKKVIFIGTSEYFSDYNDFKFMCSIVCLFYSHIGFRIQFIQNTELGLQNSLLTLKENSKSLNCECVDEIEKIEHSDLKMIFCIGFCVELDFYNCKCPKEISHSNLPFVLTDYSNMMDVKDSAGYIHTLNIFNEKKCKIDLFEY